MEQTLNKNIFSVLQMWASSSCSLPGVDFDREFKVHAQNPWHYEWIMSSQRAEPKRVGPNQRPMPLVNQQQCPLVCQNRGLPQKR